MAEKHTPNDQRSDVKNPNNPAYHQDRANQAQQGQRPAPVPPSLPPAAPKKG